MKKMTRQAQILIFAFILVIFMISGFLILNYANKDEKELTTKDEYSIQLVSENTSIMSTYINSISTEKSSAEFTENTMTIPKGTKIDKIELSQDQTFKKYIKLEGPNGEDILSKKSKQVVTHYAYSMLLVGDVQEKTNLTTKEKTYEIVNARITYDQIPMVLLSNENSVCLTNKAKSKEKFVQLQDFIQALKDIKKRETMISW
ncbi:MAG: hypothetical protein RR630_03330 [Coprobacillus sp.]